MSDQIKRIDDALNRQSAGLLIPVETLVASARQPQWLIEGVKERNTLSVEFGDGSSGKSVRLLDEMIRVVLGLPVHGREVHQGPAVIILGEGHSGYQRRLAAWQAHHKHKLDCNGQLVISRYSVPLRHPKAAQEIENEIKALADTWGKPPVAIAIDTMARNFGDGNENSAEDMGAFIEAVDRHLCRPFNAAVTLLHHTGHAEKDRARGSSVLSRAVDSEYLIEKLPDGIVRMTPKKGRDFVGCPPLHWRLVGIPLMLPGLSGDLGPCEGVTVEDVKDYEPSKASAVQPKHHRALEMLTEEIYRRRDNLQADGRDPNGVRTPVEEWRDLCYDSGLFTGNNRRNHFQRAKVTLVTASLIRVEHGFVELTDTGEKA